MKKITSLLLTVLCLQLAAQEFKENFDSLSAGELISSSNTSFADVRIGSGGGAIDATQPSSIGRDASMRLGGSTSNSQNNVKSDSLGSSQLSSFHVSMFSSNSSLGDLFIGVGKYGTSVSNNANLSQNDLQWAIRFDNGLLRYRSQSGSWLSSGVRFTDNTLQEFYFLVNGSPTPVYYGNHTLQSNSMDIWLNGSLVAKSLEIKNAQAAEAFKIYQTSGGQYYEFDDIEVYLDIVPPVFEVQYDGTWSKPQAPLNLNSAYGWRIEDSLQLNSSHEVAFISVAPQSELKLQNGSCVLIIDSLLLNGTLTVEDSAAVLLDSSILYSGSGQMTLLKTLPTTGAGYTFVSSPVGDILLNQTNIGSCLAYQPLAVSSGGTANDAWQNSGDSLQTGKGYASYWQGPGYVRFTGKPVYGEVNIRLDSNQVTPSGTWNLIGNPYSSGLDLTAFLNKNQNISNNIYCWNGNEEKYELYDASSNMKLSSAQAFFVFYLKDSAAMVSFSPSMQTDSMATLARKNAGYIDLLLSSENSSESLFRLKINEKFKYGPDVREELPFAFTNEGGIMAIGNDLQAYSVLAYPPVDSSLRLPLKMLAEPGIIQITAKQFSLSEYKLYLIDKKQLLSIPLKNDVHLFYEPSDSLRYDLVLMEQEHTISLDKVDLAKDKVIAQNYYDVTGRELGALEMEEVRSYPGVLIRRTIYRSGRTSVEKIIH